MINLDTIRSEFAKYLVANPDARWRMDAALAHVVKIAYEKGIADGVASERARGEQ